MCIRDSNKALDVFNTAVVTPIYYVMFTTLTLIASSIMFQDYADQTAKEVMSQLCGFVTILCGVFTLHVTKDVELGGMGPPGSARKKGGGPGARERSGDREEMLRGVEMSSPHVDRGGSVRVNLGRQSSGEGLDRLL